MSSDRGGIIITFDDIKIKEILDNLISLQGVGSLKTLSRVLRKSSKKTTELAREYAPLGATGELKDSIRTAVRKPRSGNVVVETGTVVRKTLIQDELEVVGEAGETIGTVKVKRISDASWRWHWVEFGSIHNHAYAYLRRAWDETSSGYIPDIRDQLQLEVKRCLKNGISRKLKKLKIG